jgi:hypothetical protein
LETILKIMPLLLARSTMEVAILWYMPSHVMGNENLIDARLLNFSIDHP